MGQVAHDRLSRRHTRMLGASRVEDDSDGSYQNTVIDHVSLPVRDLEQSTTFYESVLSRIGFKKLVVIPATVGFGRKYPELWLNHRPEMNERGIDDGFHVCLRARTVDAVQAFHEAAIAADGESDGAPGPRPQYSAGYYAAFIRDLDGNRLEVVTFVETA